MSRKVFLEGKRGKVIPKITTAAPGANISDGPAGRFQNERKSRDRKGTAPLTDRARVEAGLRKANGTGLGSTITLETQRRRLYN